VVTSLTEHDILKLHKIAMDKVIEDAGKYRQDDYIAVKGAQFTSASCMIPDITYFGK
jgi:Fic family protein